MSMIYNRSLFILLLALRKVDWGKAGAPQPQVLIVSLRVNKIDIIRVQRRKCNGAVTTAD